jgi:hypothetical protein
MLKAVRASVLILLIACSAQAGYMPNDSPTPPQQQSGYIPNDSAETSQEPTDSTQELDASGDVQNGVTASLTEIALSLLSSLPSLL